jgi:uncharacterized membrane protein YebE (DUF533 family)
VDIERLLGSVIEGALTGRRKRGRGALRFLRGGARGGASPFLNASTLLTLAGVAWGVFETVTSQQAAGAGPAPAPTRPSQMPPPLASAPGASSAPGPVVVPPPLPVPPTSPSSVAPGPVTSGVARIIRLTVAAARADGTLTDLERSSILSHARQVGAEAIVEEELRAPTPLPALVAGLEPGAQRDDFYTLAFSIVRADESVSDAERAWLADLASALAFSADRVASLESQAGARIAAASADNP